MGATEKTTTPRSHERLYLHAAERVADAWGQNCSAKLGALIYRALFLEQVLILAAGQDESVSDAKVRLIIEGAPEYVDAMLERNRALRP